MGFHVVYVADGDLNTVRKVKYVDRIRNFAYLSQPYNKMRMLNIPAIEGVYDLDYITPDEDMELHSIVVTCSGYGENDYYNLWVNNELWFDTWFPTEVKEGLYVGTNSYVYVLPPSTPIKLKFVNKSGTAKKLWLGIRMLRNPGPAAQQTVPLVDVDAISEPIESIDDLEPEDLTTITPAPPVTPPVMPPSTPATPTGP